MIALTRISRVRLFSVLLALLIGAALVVARPVDAHQPHFNVNGTPDPTHPYVLKHLDISQVVYGTLGTPGRVDFYQMTVPDGFAADVQIVVPAVPACARFRPVLAVSGRGLASAATPVPTATPVPNGPALATPNVAGSWSVLQSNHWGTFFEPFTRTTYATGPHLTGKLVGGTYLLAVYDPSNRIGTYGLSLGGSEKPGGDADFLARIGPINHCEVAS